MTKLRKRKNEKKKEKKLVNIRSSFGVGPQEISFSTTNLPNITQSKCFPLGLLSDLEVDPHDRFSINVIEYNEYRFSNTYVIS